jgi:hypothetical protein
MNRSLCELDLLYMNSGNKVLQNGYKSLRFGRIATHKIINNIFYFKTQNTAKKFQKTYDMNCDVRSIKESATRIAWLQPKEYKDRQLSPLLSTSFIAAIDKQESVDT